jgi:omega-6 fatty acid desaturase / acyl-lipid omega-6 desaturase (Delta-12 desaturase)
MSTRSRNRKAASGSEWTRQPTSTPPFTLAQLRKAIPPHCFKRSLLKSSLYLAADLLAVALLYFASTFIDPAPIPTWTKYSLLWPLYWFFQGAVCTGIWVVAHECGHQAFSESQTINDTVGLILHSSLLVPYYSWKHSHRRHHSNTGSVEKDEVFVPNVREEVTDSVFEYDQLFIFRLVKLVTTLTLGWPLYLLFNVASRPYDRFTSHFDPWSPIFSKRERVEIAISDAALVGVLYGLGALARSFGWAWLIKSYVIPYLVVNHWLVMITLMQHTHPELPHYKGKDWDWLRGALATVDRNYGWLLNTLHHHIADTHVCHHLFSQMPHYHAEEATEAIKPLLKGYYKKDDRNVWVAMWDDWALCRYVAPDDPNEDGGALWYRK